ncbi:hypothetical protein PMAYCL1PPCAC_22521, partial [Pristionchus mayeri]
MGRVKRRVVLLLFQMMVPSNSRTAATALFKLISGIITIPAAQLIGVISDAIRGDSTTAEDKFHAYQMALLLSAAFAIANAICDVAVIFFFAGDYERAVEKDREDGVVDEKTSLIGGTKVRTESLIDAVVRSRTITMNSF